MTEGFNQVRVQEQNSLVEITSMGTPARPCLSILSNARDEMYTCSAVSTAGVSLGGDPPCPKPGMALPRRKIRSIF